MAKAIKPGQLETAINEELTLYSKGVIDAVKDITKKKMQELVKQTKATAPVGRRSKHYRDSISSKTTKETDREIVRTWYVKGSDYRLSHLLNNGHATRNGGRYPGTHFITKAYEPIEKEYEKEVEDAIENVK